MQIQKVSYSQQRQLSFKQLVITPRGVSQVAERSETFNEILNKLIESQKNNNYAEVVIHNLKTPFMKLVTGDVIRHIWHFKDCPAQFMLIDEKQVDSYDIRNRLYLLKQAHITQPEYMERKVKVFDEKLKKMRNVKVQECVRPFEYNVGQYLPDKYHHVVRVQGCTSDEMKILRRIKDFCGFANYLDDIDKAERVVGYANAIDYVNENLKKCEQEAQ